MRQSFSSKKWLVVTTFFLITLSAYGQEFKEQFGPNCSITLNSNISDTNRDSDWIFVRCNGTTKVCKIDPILLDGWELDQSNSIQLSDRPKARGETNSAKHSALGQEVRDDPVKIVLPDSIAESINSIANAINKPENTYSPTEYELAKEDVEVNQRGMMIAAWCAFVAMIATIVLLVWNALLIRKSNTHMETASVAAVETFKETQISNIRRDKPYLSFVFESYEIKEISPKTLDFKAKISVKNVGQTPVNEFHVAHIGVSISTRKIGHGIESPKNQYAKYAPDDSPRYSYFGYLSPGEQRTIPITARLLFSKFLNATVADKLVARDFVQINSRVTFKDISTTTDKVRAISFYCASVGNDGAMKGRFESGSMMGNITFDIVEK